MKKSLLFIFCLLSLGYVKAQVGINTKNPQGVFHIDPKGDTNGTANTSDDVIIDGNGNVGLGVIKPSYKLDINTGGTSALPIPGFRLEDGNQGAGKVLMSDDDGVATWQTIGGSQFLMLINGALPASTAIGTRKFTFTDALTSPYINPTLVKPANGTIEIPTTGIYLVSINGWWGGREPGKNFLVVVILRRQVGNFIIWRPHTMGNSSLGGAQPSFVTPMMFTQGDIISLENDESYPYYAGEAIQVSLMLQLLK